VIGLFDYDVVVVKVCEFCLLVFVVGYLVYFWWVDFVKMCEIVDEVGVVLMVDMVYFVGLVVGKVFIGDEDLVLLWWLC